MLTQYTLQMPKLICGGENTLEKIGGILGDSNKIAVFTDKGIVLDLVLPVVVLVICCVFGMVYTGGIFEGESFVNSFAKIGRAHV